MTEDEFWTVALNFAKVVSEKAKGMFKKKENYDDCIIEYYIVNNEALLRISSNSLLRNSKRP